MVSRTPNGAAFSGPTLSFYTPDGRPGTMAAGLKVPGIPWSKPGMAAGLKVALGLTREAAGAPDQDSDATALTEMDG